MNKLKFLLRCVVSMGLIWFVLHKVNWAQLREALGRLDWHLALPASLLVLLLIVSLALRWRLFLRQQGIELPFSTVFSLTWAGQFFNSTLPGSTGGDVVKIYQLCRIAPDRKAAAAASVLVDRFSALVALVVLAAIALIMDPAPLAEAGRHAGTMESKALIGLALVVFASLAALISYRMIRHTHWHGRLVRTLTALKSSLAINRLLFAAMLMSLGIHCLNFFIIFLFARALGIGISYFQVLQIFPVVLLLIMAPVTVNGHGLRELLLVFYFNYAHIGMAANPSISVNDMVIALSMVLIPNDLLWSLPGGIWYLLRFKKADPALAGEPSR